jgi:flagellin
MRINTNVGALSAARSLSSVQDMVKSSAEKLASGFRINKASDDAAGLGIANKLRGDIRAYSQAARNAEQANSVYNIAEGSAQSIQKMLERMKELATQSASDSVDGAGRTRINAEFLALRSEIDRTVSTTKFQGNTLLNGSFGATVTGTAAGAAGVQNVRIGGAAAATYTITNSAGALTITGNNMSQTIAAGTVADGAVGTLNFDKAGIQVDVGAGWSAAGLAGTTAIVATGSGTFLVGASGDYAGQDTLQITGSDLDLDTTTLGIGTSTVGTLANSQSALTALDTAMSRVSTALGVIGAGQSRIENAVANLKTTIQNFTAAESVIRDVDMADEMVKFSKNQILAQAGTAMLAQANQSGQGVLRLLQ